MSNRFLEWGLIAFGLFWTYLRPPALAVIGVFLIITAVPVGTNLLPWYNDVESARFILASGVGAVILALLVSLPQWAWSKWVYGVAIILNYVVSSRFGASLFDWASLATQLAASIMFTSGALCVVAVFVGLDEAYDRFVHRSRQARS